MKNNRVGAPTRRAGSPPDQLAYTRFDNSSPERGLAELKALAEQGSIASMIYIAHTYRKLKGDLVQSNEWYQRAMRSGSLVASYELGRNYYDSRDYLKALEAFKVGESKLYAPSMRMLGVMYWKALGVERDIGKARDLFERAVALGNSAAKSNLATLLLRGHFGLREFVKGFRLWMGSVKDAYSFVPDGSDDRFR